MSVEDTVRRIRRTIAVTREIVNPAIFDQKAVLYCEPQLLCSEMEALLNRFEEVQQALKDLVDFDIGETPEIDSLCGGIGRDQLNRMERAWEQAVKVNGPRDSARHYGDKP